MGLKKEHKYRSWVEVDLDNFISNLKEIKKLIGPHVDFMQAVKADAYGHGAIEISNIALKNGARMLGVANADEGVQLRVSGIEAPVVILGPSTESEIKEIIKYNLTPSVSDLAFARKLQKAVKSAGGNISVRILSLSEFSPIWHRVKQTSPIMISNGSCFPIYWPGSKS